ncbi:hypothetical protein H2201_004175 [Coniosporium apollinis]|uniref:Hypervirulence associated protein TUDOR domain-containing protein n=2 Tax=Coniosporium TaxID=2810619 RepID=A0ABQ9NXD5_9PEZI|nr:hypothetical protein H2199_007231 [Cladosporium sp. JES 115]KAJ9665691.1 hypothetical protein H2201_004175 [Coniosporium apollinis]
MVLPRSTAFPASFTAQFARAPRALRSAGPQPWKRFAQRTARRGYASAGETMKKAGSDLPWLIGAIAVTVPSCAYLLQPSSDSQGHHGADAHKTRGEPGKQDISELNPDVGEDEGKSKIAPSGQSGEGLGEYNADNGEDDSDQGKDDSGKDEGDSGKDEGGSDDGDSGNTTGEPSGYASKGKLEKPQNQTQNPDEAPTQDEEHVTDTPDNKGEPSGVQFKGRSNQGDAEGRVEDVRKHVPDAKGGAKKRIESTYGNKLGAASPVREDREDDGKAKDKAVASKEPLDHNHTSGKQSGLSNTDTKHSEDIAANPEKSKKGEGAPETAKLQGPVDPSRPMPENKSARDDTEKA